MYGSEDFRKHVYTRYLSHRWIAEAEVKVEEFYIHPLSLAFFHCKLIMKVLRRTQLPYRDTFYSSLKLALAIIYHYSYSSHGHIVYFVYLQVRALQIGCKGNKILAVLHLALQQFSRNFWLKIGVESSLPEPYIGILSGKEWFNIHDI